MIEFYDKFYVQIIAGAIEYFSLASYEYLN